MNGENFIEFAHRLGIEQISHLIIEEGLKVYYIRFESKEEVEKSV